MKIAFKKSEISYNDLKAQFRLNNRGQFVEDNQMPRQKYCPNCLSKKI